MPKKNKNHLLEKKVENQAKSIKQLLGEIEELKVKTTRYMEQAHKYRGEMRDLRVICESYEELLREKEKALTDVNKSLEEVLENNNELFMQHQEDVKRIQELEKALEVSNENKLLYLRGFTVARQKLQLELNTPWYKKIFRRRM